MVSSAVPPTAIDVGANALPTNGRDAATPSESTLAQIPETHEAAGFVLLIPTGGAIVAVFCTEVCAQASEPKHQTANSKAKRTSPQARAIHRSASQRSTAKVSNQTPKKMKPKGQRPEPLSVVLPATKGNKRYQQSNRPNAESVHYITCKLLYSKKKKEKARPTHFSPNSTHSLHPSAMRTKYLSEDQHKQLSRAKKKAHRSGLMSVC